MKNISWNKRHVFSLLVGLFSLVGCLAPNNYFINIDVHEKEIIKGHLNLGGSNPRGDSNDVNSYYITRNNKPFFPVIGEFHYSRYPDQYLNESIKARSWR